MNTTGIKMETTFTILPFGQAIITIRSNTADIEKSDKNVVYSEPQTTEQSLTEVNFDDACCTSETTVATFL